MYKVLISFFYFVFRQAQDILKGVHQDRSLELYYAAVTTVIPTAVTSVLSEQFEKPIQDDQKDSEKKSDKSDVGQLEKTSNSNTNATVARAENDYRKVNDGNNIKRVEEKGDVYRKDEVENNRVRTKERTNTHDHDDRTTNGKPEEQLTVFSEGDVQHESNDVATQRTLPLPESNVSGRPNFVNTEKNIYEFYEDEDEDDEEEEDEDDIGPIVERTRKDTSHIEGVTWQSLQRLAEFATASNPDLSLINLVTPNPDIEITIEVLPGLGADDDDLSSANEVTQTKSPKRKGKGKKGKGKRKKDKDKDRTNKESEGGERVSPNIPSRHGAASEEEETNKPVNNGGKEDESSYSFHIGGPLLPFIPDDFEDFNFPDGKIQNFISIQILKYEFSKCFIVLLPLLFNFIKEWNVFKDISFSWFYNPFYRSNLYLN